MRLIPAHAGKTTWWTCTTAASPAHPRSRGENDTEDVRGPEVGGSSPLTRGKPVCLGVPAPILRLIPAHAGKTASVRRPIPPTPAHPRSRGENANFLGGVVSSPGSSPLTRGKHGVRARCRVELRLIPAHAGKTEYPATGGQRPPAHPRSRGENFMRGCWQGRCSGSSPLTRGKRKTRWQPTAAKAAHPRSRGENPRFLEIPGKGHGSSPLTRGKHHG